jgi:hypothetical protein
MKAKKIGYWTTTGLVAFALAFGGALDIASTPEVLAVLSHLGYPPYFGMLIGGWKVLGALAILAPGFPRLKEWAYAGIAFDFTGAAVSHAAVGDGASAILTPLVLLGLAIASWALRPESRKLLAPPTSRLAARSTATGELRTA